MKNLRNFIKSNNKKIREVTLKDVFSLETKLGFNLSEEYKEYLTTFGLIVFKSFETYGLGVPDDYYLNVWDKYKDLSTDSNYPKNTVPLLEIGDGQYYLYDNSAQKVLLWATPHGGIIRTIDKTLESFLIELLFKEN